MTFEQRTYIRQVRDAICRQRGNVAEQVAAELRMREAQRGRERRARAREGHLVGPHNRDKTECKHGHPFDHENTYVNAVGHRSCRTCRRLQMRFYSARSKQAA